jgi:hypothetical protein
MEEKLEQMGLKKGSGHTGFTIPPDYFEELDAQIQTRISLENLPPSASHGFTVPKDYFDQLTIDIISKTHAERKPLKLFRFMHSSAFKYASAACFAVIVAAGVFFNTNRMGADKSGSSNAEDLAAEQILFDIDEQIVIEHIESLYQKPSASADDQALENYILNNYSQSDLASNL